jgi:hypothetical protein
VPADAARRERFAARAAPAARRRSVLAIVLEGFLCLLVGGGIGAGAYYYVFPTAHRRAYLALEHGATPSEAAAFVRDFPTSRWVDEVDHALWRIVGGSVDPRELDRYAEVFPAGAHVAAAAERAAYLRLPETASVAEIAAFVRAHPRSPWVADLDARMWKAGASSKIPERTAKAYLDAFPEGAHAAEARERVAFAALRRAPSAGDAEKFLAEHPTTTRRDEIDAIWWTAATTEPVDGAALRRYVEAFPKGRHASEAKEWIDYAALRDAPSVDAAVRFLADHPASRFAVEVDDLLWREVATSERIDDHERYLAALPAGKNAPKAKEAIDWLLLRAAPTAEGAEDFLREHPDAVRSRDADEILWNAVVAAGRVEDYRRYLAAVPKGAHRGEANEIVDFTALATSPSIEAAAKFLRDFPASPRARTVWTLQLALLEEGPLDNAHAPSLSLLRVLLESAGEGRQVPVTLSGFPSPSSEEAVRRRLDEALRRFGFSLAKESVAEAVLRVSAARTYDHSATYSRSGLFGSGPARQVLEIDVAIQPRGAKEAAWSTRVTARTPARVSYTASRLFDNGPSEADVHRATVQELSSALAPLLRYPGE